VGSLTGKVALVTGGSRGIGAETARLLARDGAQVVVNYRDKAKRAEQVVREIEEHGGRAVAVRATSVSARPWLAHGLG
jgi:3-oxoacyl-[acyl-carrier protein] reductase